MSRPSLNKPRLVAASLLLLSMAPTAGNIGSCGQEAEPLDATKFLIQKQNVDCARCAECALFTTPCTAACSATLPVDESFPEPCLPLVHDGEVCLDALDVASCDDYASFMAEADATIPTECNFCPVDAQGEPVRGDR